MDDKVRMQIIADNITFYRKQKGITQKELSQAIGITASTMTDYMKLRSAPSFGVIQKIADYFGVKKSDIDSTFKDEESIGGSLPDPVSKLNQELNQQNHAKWVDYGNELLERQSQTVEEEKITYMSDYRETIQKPAPGKVSAGTGYWQEDDYNTMVSFYIDEIPEDDEYDTIAITVGNSMAPKIKNGDFLFIKLTNQIDLNTIGIFQINGENFVKKLRDGYLESLNPDFDDIELSESDDIRIIGEVVSIYRDK